MEYLLVAIIGWCGTYWPRRFPLPGGGGYPNPDDPWPPYCPVCGPIIGAIAAVILWIVLKEEFGEGLGQLVVISFFGGAFGSSLVGGLLSLGKRGSAVNR